MRLHMLLLLLATSAFAQVDVKPTLIESDGPFTPDGKIELLETKILRTAEANKMESGVLNGVHYRFYYTDGSGTFAGKSGNVGQFSEPMGTNWSTACKKDPVSDQKHCYMQLKDLYVFVYPKGRVTVSIGREHFPGSTVALRVDQMAPATATAKDDGNFSAQASARLIKQIASAKTLTTRYMKWPYRSWEDQTWELYGFNETYKYITWAVERIK